MTASPASMRLRTIGLLLIPTAYATFLSWQEWRFRERLVQPASPVANADPAPTRSTPTLDASAVATLMGLTTAVVMHGSSEPLTLRASFVASGHSSRALLADAQGAQMYRLGERLPGGSILRRVEARQVVLWNNGREELLALQPAAERFLRPVEPSLQTSAAVPSRRYLRPTSSPSE